MHINAFLRKTINKAMTWPHLCLSAQLLALLRDGFSWPFLRNLLKTEDLIDYFFIFVAFFQFQFLKYLPNIGKICSILNIEKESW